MKVRLTERAVFFCFALVHFCKLNSRQINQVIVDMYISISSPSSVNHRTVKFR